MHYRALCLLSSASAYQTNIGCTSIFINILQATTGRAWVRRGSTNPRVLYRKDNEKDPVSIPNDSLGSSRVDASKPPLTPLPRRSKRVLKSNMVAMGHRSCGVLSSTTPTPSQSSKPSIPESPRKAKRLVGQDDITHSARSSSHTTLWVNFKRGPRHMPPELLSASATVYADPGCSLAHDFGDSIEHEFHLGDVDLPPPWYWDEPSLVGTPIGSEVSGTCLEPSLPQPETSASLYRNLLYLLSFRTPSVALPALLDYHDLHAGLRSVRSYNLLISLALRHASFGSVPWLLNALRKDGMRGNLETSKLTIRWLIQTGEWHQAWNQVFGSANGEEVTSSIPLKSSGNRADRAEHDIPLAIWLEFFRTLKKGTVRKRVRSRWRTNEFGEVLRQQPFEVQSEPGDTAALHSTRYDALMKKQPVLTAKEMARTSPRLVYYVVTAMLQSEKCEAALAFTTSYLTSLTPVMDDHWSRACLDIIHLFIVFGSPKKGLQKLYESRRILVTLLALHPSLRPTSTTLFLLLGNLQHTKRCGTIAWNILQNFKVQWGSRMEDRRVRRRIASFAVKEGREDIAEEIFHCEQVSRWSHRTWNLQRHVMGSEGFPSGRFLQSPNRKIFTGNGKEERLWCHLVKRARRTRQKRAIECLKTESTTVQ